jgi:hypothetical protein
MMLKTISPRCFVPAHSLWIVVLALTLLPAQAATLTEALDNAGLTWTTGGPAPWFGQTTNSHDGAAAAQAGPLASPGQVNWLETTVTGQVAVVFWWKLSSDPNGYHDLRVNGYNTSLRLSGEQDWLPAVLNLDSGTNTLRWVYFSYGINATNGRANAAWVDQVLVTNYAGLAPVVVWPPVSQTAPEMYPGYTRFDAAVVGALPISYQWLHAGTNLVQTIQPSLLLSYLRAKDAGEYRLIASNAFGVVTSAVANLTVASSAPLPLSSYPVDLVYCPDNYFSLSASVYGTPPFAYQWQKDGVPLPNATNYYYTIEQSSSADTAGYRVIVTNAYGSATSRVAQVVVTNQAPLINGESWAVRTAQLGDYTSFYVDPSGPGPLYVRWLKDGQPLEGGSSYSLYVEATSPTNSGYYWAIVENCGGSVTSRVNVLAVAPADPLGLALDAPQLGITNNSTWNDWFVTTDPAQTHDGLAAARSGRLYGYDESAFVTAIDGPTNLLFWWKISAGANAHLEISVDGSVSNIISGAQDWALQTIPLAAGPHSVQWRFYMDDNTFVGENAAWVDQVSLAAATNGGISNVETNFTTAGDSPPWHLQTTNTHDGVSAWQSGAIGDNQTNQLITAFAGPGTVSFWWMVSSEVESDFLEFQIDGAPQASISGLTNWQQKTFILGPGAHELTWLYLKDGSMAAGLDAGFVDEVTFVPAPPVVTNLNNALDIDGVVFTNGGFAPWFYQTTNTYDGVDAAQSGPIPFGEKSSFSATFSGPGTVRFWWKVSSSLGDYLNLYVDGNHATGLAGESGWRQQWITIGAGAHTLTWSYENSDPETAGLDAVWVDQITWTPDWLAEAVDAPGLVFANGSYFPWFGQTNQTHDGVDAAQSGGIAPGERSYFSTDIDGPGELTFWCKVSSATADPFDFYLDGQLAETNRLAGELDWQQRAYALGPGAHRLEWIFARQSDTGAGANAVWVDEITFTRRFAPSITAPPQPAKLLKGGAFELSAAAAGDPPLSYQWLKDGANIPDATSLSHGRTNCRYEDAGNYALVVANAYGAVTSAWARVAVVPTYYTIRNLGALGNNQATSEAYEINNFGEVVGRSDVNEYKSYGNRLYHAFVWPVTPSSPHMADLGDGRDCANIDATNRLPGYSIAYSINDSYDIVGSYEYRTNPTGDGYAHAAYWRAINCGVAAPVFPWQHCPLELLDMHPRDIYVYPPDTGAVSVNARRQMLLQAGQGWVLQHYAYLLTPNDPFNHFTTFNARPIGVSGGFIDPYAMNNSGLIVGRYRENIGYDFPYLYDGWPRVGSDTTTNIFPAPAYWRYLTAVNDRGVMAGLYYTNAPGGGMMRHAFLQQPDGRLELMPDPFYSLYSLKDLNNRNQAVGTEYGNRAALWTDSHWFLLNDLLADTGGVDIRTANAINDRGQIVGQAYFPGSGNLAYLLTPGTPGNHDPVAVSDTLALRPSQPVVIPESSLLGNDTDVDGDRLHLFSVFATGTNGLTLAGGRIKLEGTSIHYTPPTAPVADDSFLYLISDSAGGVATGQVTIAFSAQAPAATPIMNQPVPQPDGAILLSGRAPAGSMILIYRSINLQTALWSRDLLLTVPASGQWSAVRPGRVEGQAAIYRAELQAPPP